MRVQSKKILFRKAIPAFINKFHKQFPTLKSHFSSIETEELKHKHIHNETYGKESMIYIVFENMDIRKSFERFIKDSKDFSFKVFEDYSPNSSVVEIQVSYFKGNKWNE